LKNSFLTLFIGGNIDLTNEKDYNKLEVRYTMRFVKTKTFRVILIIVLVFFVRHIMCISDAFYVPEYDYQSIDKVLNKEILTDDDYNLIFSQTGISPRACRELIGANKKYIIKILNSLYFEKPDIKRQYIFFPVTCEEKNTSQKTPVALLKDGDILITFNTHTLDWRHGHAAIVTDAASGEILEHKSIGNVSTLSYIDFWRKYPAFMILRHADENIAKKAADYAKETLCGIEYNLLAGFIKKDKSDEVRPTGSHCSHIVWQAYKAAGDDIDYNGGAVVTPSDIAKSDKLGLIQIYGIDPEKYTLKVLN